MSKKFYIAIALNTLCFACAIQSWAQHNVLMSDPFFEGDSIYLEKKTISIPEFILDEHFPLVQRLKTLCTECSSRTTIKGYRIFFKEDNDSGMQQHVFVSQIVAADQIDRENLKGVFYLDQTPFYIFNLPKDTLILTSTDKTTSLQLVINRNEKSLIEMTKGNQLDGIVDFEKSINYQGFTYSTFIEFCPEIKIKRRSRKTVNYLGRHDRNHSDSILEFTSFIQRFSTDSVYQINHCVFPLKVILLLDPVDETYSIDYINRVDFKFIDLPVNGNKYSSSGYYTTITTIQQDKVHLLLRHNDMGIHIEYVFSYQNNKWLLIEVRDEST